MHLRARPLPPGEAGAGGLSDTQGPFPGRGKEPACPAQPVLLALTPQERITGLRGADSVSWQF